MLLKGMSRAAVWGPATHHPCCTNAKQGRMWLKAAPVHTPCPLGEAARGRRGTKLRPQQSQSRSQRFPSSSPLPCTPVTPTGLTGGCRPSGQDVSGFRASWNLGGSGVEVATAVFSTMHERTRCAWPLCWKVKEKLVTHLDLGCGVCVGVCACGCVCECGWVYPRVHVHVGGGVRQGKGKGSQRPIWLTLSPSVSPRPGGRVEPGRPAGH